MIQHLLRKTLLKSVMTSPAITVFELEDFSVVKDKFELYSIRHLPVVNHKGVLVGLITQRDLYKIHSPRRLQDGSWYYDKDLLDGFILSKVMLSEIYTLKPENTLEDVVNAMVQFKFGCIPIVDDNNIPVGIITNDNILNFLLTK